MRIAIAWEDEYFRPLERILLGRRAAVRPPTATEYLELVQYTLAGNGKFAAHVETMWPRAQARGTANNPGPLAHLVCALDADRLAELIPAVGQIPAEPANVAGWHASAETRLTEHLRARATHPATVHGIVLRWAKESLTLAAYDLAAMKDKLGVDAAGPAVQRFLADCTPSPGGVPDGLFTDTFRKPVPCVDALREAQGLPGIGKGSSLDDVLFALAPTEVDVVCRRVPDVDRLLALAWRLALGVASAPTPGPPPAATPRGTRKK
jgi:hypothetical protein